MKQQPTSWEKARQYLAWAKRHKFSKETILTLPSHPSLDLSNSDRALLINLINSGQ